MCHEVSHHILEYPFKQKPFSKATFKNTIILFVCPSKILHKHCFQEKIKAILMQNFGGTKKEYYGIFESGLLNML